MRKIIKALTFGSDRHDRGESDGRSQTWSEGRGREGDDTRLSLTSSLRALSPPAARFSRKSFLPFRPHVWIRSGQIGFSKVSPTSSGRPAAPGEASRADSVLSLLLPLCRPPPPNHLWEGKPVCSLVHSVQGTPEGGYSTLNSHPLIFSPKSLSLS